MVLSIVRSQVGPNVDEQCDEEIHPVLAPGFLAVT